MDACSLALARPFEDLGSTRCASGFLTTSGTRPTRVATTGQCARNVSSTRFGIPSRREVNPTSWTQRCTDSIKLTGSGGVEIVGLAATPSVGFDSASHGSRCAHESFARAARGGKRGAPPPAPPGLLLSAEETRKDLNSKTLDRPRKRGRPSPAWVRWRAMRPQSARWRRRHGSLRVIREEACRSIRRRRALREVGAETGRRPTAIVSRSPRRPICSL